MLLLAGCDYFSRLFTGYKLVPLFINLLYYYFTALINLMLLLQSYLGFGSICLLTHEFREILKNLSKKLRIDYLL